MQGRFERLVEGETNSDDVEIHEHVIVDGPTGQLATEIQHFPFPFIENTTGTPTGKPSCNWSGEKALLRSSMGA